MKIQRKISLIFWTDLIFALISRHFIGLSRYFRLWKVMPQIKEPVSNKFNVIELKIQEIIFFAKSWILTWIFFKIQEIEFLFLIFMDFFNTCLFIWYISVHHVKHLDKPIKCLEMRAKIKSVRKINETFFCIFTYIWKSDIFPPFQTEPHFSLK